MTMILSLLLLSLGSPCSQFKFRHRFRQCLLRPLGRGDRLCEHDQTPNFTSQVPPRVHLPLHPLHSSVWPDKTSYIAPLDCSRQTALVQLSPMVRYVGKDFIVRTTDEILLLQAVVC